MKSFLRNTVLVGMLTLSGCAYFSPNPNVVATMEASLAAADHGAIAYVTLPTCGTTSGATAKLCSKPQIVEDIRVAATAAYSAVKACKAAENADTIAAAQQAIATFQTIVSAL